MWRSHYASNVLLLSLAFVAKILPAESKAGTWGSSSAEVRTLSCCTVIRYPNIYETRNNATHNLAGLAMSYLMELEARVGFKCSSIERFNGTGTGFNALIERMESCSNGTLPRTSSQCRCQLGVGGWQKTSGRIGRVRFLPEFIRTDVVVLTHVDNTNTMSSADFFLGAFSVQVWIMIWVLFLLFTFLRMMDRRFEPPPANYRPLDGENWFLRARHYLLKSELMFRLRKAAVRTVFELLGGASADSGGGEDTSAPNGAGNRRDTFRQRIITLLVSLCGIFFMLAYEATMTASMVNEAYQAKYRTIHDFKNCDIPIEHVCIPKGCSVKSIWSNSFGKEHCNLGKMPNQIGSHEEVIEAVANKTCKFLVTTGVTAGVAATGKHCEKVVKVGAPIMKHGLSMIMTLHMDDTVFSEMEKATYDLLENDSIQSLDSYFDQLGSCPIQNSGKITLAKTRVFFLAAFVSVGIMFFAMLFDSPMGKSGSEDEDKKVDHEA